VKQTIKILLLSSFTFCVSCISFAQNLVLNPSFENYSTCPSAPGDIYKAIGWDTYNGSPDYFNSCGSGGVQVPGNSFGYQQAAAGNAYAGIITYYNGGLSREIIGDSLSTLLVPTQKYYLSFKINRADDETIIGYSTNKIGARFTTIKSFSVNINNTPHIFSNSVITDTTNWIRVTGSFVADSAYQYLLIGNFFDDANTTITNQTSGIYAYYFIDEVCLSTDSMFCANFTTSIDEFYNSQGIFLFPNPSNHEVLIKIFSEAEMCIYSSLGQIIVTNSIGSEWRIITSDWANGIYFVKINDITLKLIIHH